MPVYNFILLYVIEAINQIKNCQIKYDYKSGIYRLSKLQVNNKKIMMKKNAIRPLALAIIKNKNKILVCQGYDGYKFYRLPGGGIEFGETGVETLKREIKEEFDADIENIKYLSTLENMFSYRGQKGHEICLVYLAELKGNRLLDKKEITVLDDEENIAVWAEIKELKKAILYPDGAEKLLNHL